MNSNIDDYLNSSRVGMERSRQTLDISEHFEMLFTRKRMTLMYQVLMAWSSLARRNQM